MVEVLINQYRSEIKQGFELLDQVVDTCLIGSGCSPDARRMILIGSMLSGLGAISILIGGGLMAAEITGAVSVLTGLSGMARGLYLGYKSYRQKSREELLTQINNNLDKSNTDRPQLISLIKDIFITT
jgi:uncharacterized membrane protein YebE (DUF533 family)